MENRPTLNRVWSSSGQNIRDPGDDKYASGWVAEIPTSEVFNFLQNKIDKTFLAIGERGIPEWGGDVSYKQGALVWNEVDDLIYIALAENPDSKTSPNLNTSQWAKSAVQISRVEFDALNNKISEHIAQHGEDNPHKLTPHDVGTYAQQEIDAMFSANDDINNAHIADMDNPHGDTAEKIGAVPVTGGTYEGPVTLGAGVTELNAEGTALLDASSDVLNITVKGGGLGVDADGAPGVIRDGGGFTPFGTVAIADITTTNRDTTAGRVIKTADFGIGRTIGTVTTGIDFKSYAFIQGEHLFVKMDTCTNIPAGLSATAYYFISVHGVRDSDGSPGVMFVNYSAPTEVWIGYGAGAAGSRTWSMSRLLNTAGFEMSGVITVNGEGHGSYASQNGNKAPLYQLINSGSTSEYWPMVKQKYTQGNSTWSMGRIVNADAMVVHYVSAADPNGKNFYFNKDGTFVPLSYANFDAKYQAKGSFVTGVRLGASKDVTNGSGNLADQSGYVVTMGGDFGSNDGYYRLRPIQYLVNGSWINSVSA